MFLTLVGMSGSGKSFWSKRLAYEEGFRNFYCDDLIEQKLRSQIPDFPGNGIGAVAKWLGYPSDPDFSKHEALYLQHEIAVMREVLGSLPLGKKSSKIVIDTSGSVIYAGDAALEQLRQQTTIVYLRIPDSERHSLLEQFLRDPKPVLWNGMYQEQAGETPEQALRRCYPLLLQERIARYEALAHVTIELALASRAAQTTKSFLAQAGVA